jgi:tRNA-specific 2-thiouridylase
MSNPASKTKAKQVQKRNKLPKKNEKRVLLGMSGGNDCAVAAALLQSQGYDVVGVYLEMLTRDDAALPEFESFKPRCCQEDQRERAERICKKLGIDFQIHSVAETYENEVTDVFVHETLNQRFPNLCSRCHVQVRLQSLYKLGQKLGCGKIATGHFARVNFNHSTGNFHLSRAASRELDQSYFLHAMSQEMLSEVLFPLGSLSAGLIDKLAIQLELGVRNQKDAPATRGLCLETVSDNPLLHPARFIEARAPVSFRLPGMFNSKNDGTILGDHKGIHHFRIGQASGFKLNLEKTEGLRVVGFEAKANNVYIGVEADLYHSDFILNNVNWVIPFEGIRGLLVQVQLHIAEEPIPGRITLFDNDHVLVELKQPRRLLQLGQTAVFYQGDDVLGGGWIHQILKPAAQSKKSK